MRSMIGRNCTIMGKAGTPGGIPADATEVPADEDELLDDRGPPPPLVRLPTEATDAVRADERSDPKLWDNEAVADDNRFYSHSAI